MASFERCDEALGKVKRGRSINCKFGRGDGGGVRRGRAVKVVSFCWTN